MPVGVPKVAFEVPGDDEATWIDLYYQLFYDRLLFLGQEVNSEIAISNQVTDMMIYLSQFRYKYILDINKYIKKRSFLF
jgi:ATP-dependent Clp protease protease subunit